MIIVLAGAAVVWLLAAVFGTDSREGRDWEWRAPAAPIVGRAVRTRRGRPSERCSQ